MYEVLPWGRPGLKTLVRRFLEAPNVPWSVSNIDFGPTKSMGKGGGNLEALCMYVLTKPTARLHLSRWNFVELPLMSIQLPLLSRPACSSCTSIQIAATSCRHHLFDKSCVNYQGIVRDRDLSQKHDDSKKWDIKLNMVNPL